MIIHRVVWPSFSSLDSLVPDNHWSLKSQPNLSHLLGSAIERLQQLTQIESHYVLEVVLILPANLWHKYYSTIFPSHLTDKEVEAQRG